MKKIRLDVLLRRRGLVSSRERAQRLIRAGQVLVDDRVVDKASFQVEEDARVEIRRGLPYVSRGGYKLAKALDTFDIDPAGWIVADVGASTGGFTDCLLQRGAKRVYAVDVGYGQLDWQLRNDSRVVVMERTNARHLEELPEAIDLATIDVSFISLRLILPQVIKWLAPDGQVIALIKPQFEAGPDRVGKGGVVRDGDTRRAVLREVLSWALAHGWSIFGLTASPIKGAKGNVEFLAWLGTGRPSTLDLEQAVDAVVEGTM
ncbi:MAG: TlyA family RNA methyltransferase [Anaerolineae bacterium]